MRIYSRAEWGARRRDGYDGDYDGTPEKYVWAHHSVTAQLPVNASFEQECAVMRALEDIGENNFNAGISYTFLIFPSGRIYEGHTIDRAGAHTIGYNYTARAICFVGNYEVNYLNEAQLNSAASLLVHGRELKWWLYAAFSGGHRDVFQTACPGIKAYGQLAEINRRAAAGVPGRTNELNADERYALLDLHDVFKNVFEKYGKPFSTLFGELYDVLAAGYTLDPGTGTEGEAKYTSIGEKVVELDDRVEKMEDTLNRIERSVNNIASKLAGK